jgi:hypothetical protein
VKFWLGTHETGWAARVAVPWFLSASRLRRRPVRRRVVGSWALDSGGFSELSMHGRWTTGAGQYLDEIAAWSEVMGAPEWAAPQDWMCEPAIRVATGLSVEEHQARTIASVVELRAARPGVAVVPVLQGWVRGDYFRHVRMYEDAGIDLYAEPLVGVGTVCRRQASSEGIEIVGSLASSGLRLHGFGLKLTALSVLAPALVSADSMAWSYAGRMQPHRNGCPKRSCANCLHWAMEWRDQVLASSGRVRPVSRQVELFGACH